MKLMTIGRLRNIYLNTIKVGRENISKCNDYSIHNFDNVLVMVNAIISLIQIDKNFWMDIKGILDESEIEYLSNYMSEYSNICDVYEMYKNWLYKNSYFDR